MATMKDLTIIVLAFTVFVGTWYSAVILLTFKSAAPAITSWNGTYVLECDLLREILSNWIICTDENNFHQPWQ